MKIKTEPMRKEVIARGILVKGYWVYDDGRIWSDKVGRFLNGRLVGQRKYHQVCLYTNDTQNRCMVHRLVAEAFIPNPENKKEVNHKNGIRLDNRVENLEWVTPLENIRHAIATGLINNVGENSGRAKLTEKDVRNIRELKNVLTGPVLAKMYSVDKSTIGNIWTRRIWKHVI